LAGILLFGELCSKSLGAYKRINGMSKWAFEIGADDYITKPSDMMKLGKIVKTKWEKYTEPVDVR
jgi:FixJ family two-component response regulator